jgi:5-methylcytosine-specific restriction endonuclease McrA
MPVDRSKYPPNWREISHDIRFRRARGKCEGSPKFPNCEAEHGQPHPETGSKVILTVAHLDHNPSNNTPSNLRAMCQRCHLSYDAKFHARNAEKTKRKKNIKRLNAHPKQD